MKGFDIFTKSKTYYAVYPRINGLIKSNPVSINGLRTGQVSDIYFEPDLSGLIVVEFVITTDLPIPNNSIVSIYSSDLMGSKAIEIILGNSNEYIQDGDTLPSKLEASLKEAVNQQIQPLKYKAEELIQSIDSVVIIIQSIFNKKAREDLAQSIQSIRQTFKNIENASFDIDNLVTSQKNRLAEIFNNLELITGNLKNNNDNINNIINNFSTISDSLAKAEIPRTFNNINSTINDLAKIADKINKGEGTLGLLVNDDKLYNELQKSAADLNKLLEDIQQNPKKYVRFSLF